MSRTPGRYGGSITRPIYPGGLKPDGIVSDVGLCEGLKAVDIENADESFMEYETLTSDDRKAELRKRKRKIWTLIILLF